MRAHPPASGSRPGTWRWPAGGLPALIAVVSSLAEADAAVQAGADLVDLGPASPQEIITVRDRYPDVGVCADRPPADVVRDVAAAQTSGAMAIGTAAQAHASLLPASRLLVVVPPALVPPARESGWAAVVDVDQAAAQARGSRGQADHGDTGIGDDNSEHDGSVLAIAVLASWLGATAVRTHLPGQVRRALDMTASIRGLRPPARAVRGLA